MIIECITFIASGLCAGVLSSMFGLGGGIVVVPMLYWFFRLNGMNSAELMHMAVGTSLAVMIVTTAGSIFGHYKKKNIHWPLLKPVFLCVAFGAIIGAVSSRWLHSDVLKYLFIAFLGSVILQALFNKGFTKTYKASDCYLPRKSILCPVGFFAGLLSVLLGIGGSVFTVPFMRNYKFPMERASGTAVALTPAVSILGSLGYVYAGMHSVHLPPYSFGYINVPAFALLSIGSLCGVPLGLKIASRISDHVTAKIYICLLFAILILMLV